jgi:hypothetical protein
LDNKEITPVEKKRAEMVLKKEESILNMLFSNECLIMKLQLVCVLITFLFSLTLYLFNLNIQAVQKVQLHLELRKVVFGRLHVLNRPDIPGYTSFDVKRFLQYFYDFEEVPDSIQSKKTGEYD